jgi:putative DNA primase/helicase
MQNELLATALEHYTQSEYADRWVYTYSDRFRWMSDEDQWLWYDGTRWEEVGTDVPFHFVEEMCREILDATPAAYAEDGKSPKKNPWIDTVRTRCGTGNINAILAAARTKRPIVVKRRKLDANPYLLNTPRGTYDLSTNELREHNPSDLITKITVGNYMPGCTDDNFESSWVQAQPREETRNEIWAVHGAQITGIPGSLAVLHTGSGGNWKSTFVDMLTNALGDYADQANPKVLTSRGAEEHETIIADLHGKRVAVTHLGNQTLSPDQLRLLVDESTFKARAIQKNATTFKATHSFVVTMNPIQPIKDLSPSVVRRILSYNWTWRIPHQNPGYKSELALTSADYVITQLIEGYRRYQSPDFQTTHSSTDDLLRENPYYAFGIDCCEFDPGYEASSDVILFAATKYDRDGWGRQPNLGKTFTRQLARIWPITSERSTTVRVDGARPKVWKGIRIKEEYRM